MAKNGIEKVMAQNGNGRIWDWRKMRMAQHGKELVRNIPKQGLVDLVLNCGGILEWRNMG